MPRNLPEAAKTSNSTSVSPARVETIVESEDLSTWTLEDLAAKTKQEHGLFVEAATASLAHAIRAGEALLAARDRVNGGQWRSWVQTTAGLSPTTASNYMRIANYRGHLSDDIGIEAARITLVGLPALLGRRKAELVKEARQLSAAGQTQKAIAAQLGVRRETAGRWLNPDLKARRLATQRIALAKQRAAQKALAEKERREARNAAAKKAGGALAESNSRVRLLLESLDQAVGEAKDRELQATLREARGHADKAEYAILKALGVS